MTCTNPACPVTTTTPGLCQGCRETRRRLLGGRCVWCGTALQPDDGARCADCVSGGAAYGPAMARLVKQYQDMRYMQRVRGAA